MSDSDINARTRPNGDLVQVSKDDEETVLLFDADGVGEEVSVSEIPVEDMTMPGDEDVYRSDDPIFYTNHRQSPSSRGEHSAFVLRRTFAAVAVSCALLAGVGIGVAGARLEVLFRPGLTQASVGAATDTGFTPVSNNIVVDVKGDVRQPGLVTVPSTARVQDVVDRAGGFLHEEDSVAVNLAAPVDDGEEIVIPNVTLGSGPSFASGSNSSSTSGSVNTDAGPSSGQTQTTTQTQVQQGTTGTVDLNTADVKTLQTLPGIGPTKANAIVDYRQTHGMFQAPTDLLNVKGIGPVTYRKIAPYVVILPLK